MPPVLNECKRLITTVIWRMLHRMPYIASMIKGFFQLLLVLILCFCAEVFGQQSIPDRCEALLAAPPRPEGNQPIPEQLKIPEAPKTARQVSCFRSFSRNSTSEGKALRRTPRGACPLSKGTSRGVRSVLPVYYPSVLQERLRRVCVRMHTFPLSILNLHATSFSLPRSKVLLDPEYPHRYIPAGPFPASQSQP
jgi:hypothetical protein